MLNLKCVNFRKKYFDGFLIIKNQNIWIVENIKLDKYLSKIGVPGT